MSETPRVGAFAIVPSNNLSAAIVFWERLGFARTGGDANYNLVSGWDCEVHLIQAGAGPWRVPEEQNPFGVFIRTPDVEAIAARGGDLITALAASCATENGASTRSGSADQMGCSSESAGRPTSFEVSERLVERLVPNIL